MATNQAPRVWQWLAYLIGVILTTSGIFVILFSFPPVPEVSLPPPSELRVPRSGLFKIAIFSDLHFGEEEHGWGVDQDLNSSRVMRSVIADERPDFVVLNGDLITGENTFMENSSAYVDDIVEPMVRKGVPWGSTYGNHDSSFNLSRYLILEEEQKYDLCLTRSEDDTKLPGVSNYWLTIDDAKGHPVAVLWFLDSRGGWNYGSKPEDKDSEDGWIAPEVVDWFMASHTQIRGPSRQPLPSFIFTHIPPHIYKDRQAQGIDPALFPGLHKDNPLAHQDEDDAFVAALRQVPGVHSVYTGHDHGDSWCANWPGTKPGEQAPFLCFAKHTGYGGYGSWRKGSRIIQLDFSGQALQVQSWVRMEDGSVITKVGLNETYGLDRYTPETGEA
jgi:hypothetical protein